MPHDRDPKDVLELLIRAAKDKLDHEVPFESGQRIQCDNLETIKRIYLATDQL